LQEAPQATITLTKCAMLIFLQSWAQKLLAWLGIEPTLFDLDSQSCAFDHSTMATLDQI